MTEVITLQDLSFSYGAAPVLEHVDLAVEEGEFLGIVGPNGGGKTTLLKLVLGLLEPASGSISVLGQPPAQARRSIGYVPQFATLVRDFPITVEGAVLLGRLGSTRWLGGYRAADRATARDAMAEARILDLAARPLGTLSGGQLQRVLIARALAAQPKILMLDEPTANIDLRVEADIFELFKRLNEHITIIVVSHDVGFISHYVSRVACLNRTLVCHPTSAIAGEIIERLYGLPLQMIHHAVDTERAAPPHPR
jgi:zinc transport system ATP-binding protein